MNVLSSLRGSAEAAYAAPATLGFGALVLVVHALTQLAPGSFEIFAHADGDLMEGQVWRLVTAHLVHLDTAHLMPNLIGLFALGIPLERWIGSRKLIWLVCAGGMVISLGVLLDPSIALYCGLSGVLNTLFAALCIYGVQNGSRKLWAALLAAGLAKIGWELTNPPLISGGLDWPPHVLSHLLGYSVGLALATGFMFGHRAYQMITQRVGQMAG
ncbi:rhombosortase [Litoreibacter roseus]|uniref:Peptidase S54 rhomboid domain-containing protein n=1 Tax=Litoreibacter roseus TaxID=2601869 RepID=A0A6N6JEV5_9RHOB|nr:rhombosortase [Litoreibacter roseus]GFE64675.1 hypothetical protein KIN_17490 [Litoreibacter roseus]